MDLKSKILIPFKRFYQKIYQLLNGRTTGFEPANKGVTIQRLTTWPRPPFDLKLRFFIVFNKIISTYFAKHQSLFREKV